MGSAYKHGHKPRATGFAVLILAAILLGGLMAPPAAQAVQPDEILADTGLELRARALSKHLRCLVCQNQSIDDSNAELARDLRVIVRERLVAGDSDKQVLAFLVARYGDFVLLKPPVNPTTWPLWFGPIAVLALAGVGIFFAQGRRRAAPCAPQPAPLDQNERAALANILGQETSGVEREAAPSNGAPQAQSPGERK
jgi:cytochrome c-type biogenesis protein CcmH